jgi:hypothetical protein
MKQKQPASALPTSGGMHKGGSSPSCGGSRLQGACQRGWLARHVLAAWGAPARPGFPPEGETGKGEIKLPCCRRLNLGAWTNEPGVTE